MPPPTAGSRAVPARRIHAIHASHCCPFPVSRKIVLISYFFGHDMIPLGVSCANAFRGLGYDVLCFNSQVESPWQPALLKPVNRLARGLGYRGAELGTRLPVARINFKKRMLRQAAREFRPRWIFVIRAHEFVDAELVA